MFSDSLKYPIELSFPTIHWSSQYIPNLFHLCPTCSWTVYCFSMFFQIPGWKIHFPQGWSSHPRLDMHMERPPEFFPKVQGGKWSGQIIATSHDLTPNGGLVREFPLFQGNLGWWNIIIWPEWCSTTWNAYRIPWKLMVCPWFVHDCVLTWLHILVQDWFCKARQWVMVSVYDRHYRHL